MGRAIVREPQAFLMDEPLSNLDAKLRVQMRAEILRIQQDLQVTTIYVTHDQTEAMTLGDLVAVMRKGVLQQVATPEELYAQPVNLFVGGFIGSPAMNLVEATLSESDGATFVEFAGHRLRVPDEVVAARPGLAAFRGRTVILGHPARGHGGRGARPLLGARQPVPRRGGLARGDGLGRVPPLHPRRAAGLHRGHEGARLRHRREGARGPEGAGERERRSTFIARVGPETTAQAGSVARSFVDTRKLYFFDPDTGGSIVGDRTVASVGAAGGP